MRYLAIPLLASSFVAQDQKPASSDPKPEVTYKTDVRVVNVLATVHDKSGKIVHDLGKDDFALTDDDRPQAIAYFARQTDQPLTLGLLIDTSMSQQAVLGDERRASYKFFEK